MNNNQQAFFSLLRAGLWEKDVELRKYGTTDFTKIMRLAEEQSVVGLVAAGLEHVVDVQVPKEDVLQFVGQTLQLEQRNTAMNVVITELVSKMRDAGISTLLVKGQGVAQCYARPLWRACGDVDFFLSDDNYLKAKQYLQTYATRIEKEESYKKHLGMSIGEWVIELHGSLRCGFLPRVDRVLDDIQRNCFYDGNVRSWDNNGVKVFMLGRENDVIYVFAHCLNHFFKDGVGLRQVCDWVRLLWSYREKINGEEIEKKVKQMGMMSEWKAFAALAVGTLGMSSEAMPMYDPSLRWERKASKVLDFIMKTGNFGHNRDISYMQIKPFVIRKAISLWRHTADGVTYFSIFPLDSLKVWGVKVKMGLKSLVRGE